MAAVSEAFARISGLSEPAARVLLALLSGYPLAAVYQLAILKKSPRVQHLYFILTGFALAYFCVGLTVLHVLVDVFLIYLFILLLGPSKYTAAITWSICMSHLTYGYLKIYLDNEIHSPISWTMTYCVLTLKLIGLTMDLLDGQKRIESQSQDQREYSFQRIPSLLEILGFSLHSGTVLVGPILSFKRYRDFTEGTLFDQDKHGRNCILPGLQRMCIGIAYATVFTVLGSKVPVTYLTTDDFAIQPFWYKLCYIAVWGRINLTRYISVWLLTEGACMITGITYNGLDKKGGIKWDGLANVFPFSLETSYSLQAVIQFFNRSVNGWVARHVFKRLKFLGSKELSQLVTLVFISWWHGLWIGYLINFTFELPAVLAERKLQSFGKRLLGCSLSEVSLPLKVPLVTMAVFLRSVILHYPLACFMLLKWSDCYKFMSSVYFYGHVTCLIWLILWYSGVFGRKEKSATKRE